eukprot:Nk52_evm8s281 gene=Nk52_evmTU8s281
MRDRLAELKQKAGPSDDMADVVNMETGPEGTDSFMAEFFVLIGALRDDVNELEKLVKQIAEKHGQALAAISEKQSQQSSQELDQLQDNTQRIANRIRNKLKSIEKENKAMDKTAEGSASARIRKSQHATLSRKFIAVMNEYNEVQTTYKQKYQDRVKRQYKIVKPEATQEEIDKITSAETNVNNIFAEQILSKSHAETQKAVEDIKNRHKDLEKLEKSIMELHSLFTDMAALVEAQGEMIDRIEFNVSESAQYVEEAVIELKSAHRLQSSARRKQIYIGICLLILVLIIVVIVIVMIK